MRDLRQMAFSLVFLASLGCATVRNLMRTAPQLCPIDEGNLIDVKLFVDGDEQGCFDHCERTEGCHFFRFYSAFASASDVFPRPTQCFLFRTCGRNVAEAAPDCMVNKENTIEVVPFTKTNRECRELCQNDRKCGYYKHYPSSGGTDEVSNGLDSTTEAGESAVGRTASARSRNNLIGLLGGPTEGKSEFCYLMRSCAKRMVDKVNCTLGKNNFLDVKFFVKSSDECMSHCRALDGCRYYWWFPIDRSDAPLYCYLFQQCAPKDAEPEVTLVIGGRHPGHYYLTSKEHNDLVMRNDVCMVGTQQDVSLARAGAVAQYLAPSVAPDAVGTLSGAGADAKEGVVLFCGGRNGQGVHRDCLRFDPMRDSWRQHSEMTRPRDEASSARVGSKMFVFGGISEKSTEFFDLDEAAAEADAAEEEDAANVAVWTKGTDMPDVVARGCAVAIDQNTVMVIGGHDNSSSSSLSTCYVMEVGTGEWVETTPMEAPRRDHACLFVEFEDSKGVLVTGGLGENDDVLDSAEFFDVRTKRWTVTSGLKHGRTEHAMSLVYGIPTVIGGLNGDEFLSSIEQFDKSSASWNVPLQRDWRTINNALNTPRYEMAVASVPVSKIRVCDADIE